MIELRKAFDDDDVPTLSPYALEALKEFLATSQPPPSEKSVDGEPSQAVALPKEDWRLSQFWYSPDTATTVADEVQSLLTSHFSGVDTSVACLACPTLFAYLKQKSKGTEGIIEIENPNLDKPKNVKAKHIDLDKTTELLRREREELEKQRAHERYMKLQEQGKTDQAKKDLERLKLIREQRAEAAKKREEEKAGWHTYFWIAFVPFILLLAVGAKLEHVISQLAHEVAEKHVAIEGDLVVKPSDDLFWFGRLQLALLLIHFILFQNAFEIAYFFWIWVQYGFKSCIMGKVRYIVPRLIIGVIIQVMCSYSTLPLYAIVTQTNGTQKANENTTGVSEAVYGDGLERLSFIA